MTYNIDIVSGLKIKNYVKANPSATVREISVANNVFMWRIRQFLKEHQMPVIEHRNVDKIPVHEPIFEFNTWQVGEERAYEMPKEKIKLVQMLAQRKCFTGYKRPYKRIYSIKTKTIDGKLIVTRTA